MDATQLLLSTAVTITTILLIIVSLQLISLLKQLKNSTKDNYIINIKKSEDKKNHVIKKKINLASLLEKIKKLTLHNRSFKKAL